MIRPFFALAVAVSLGAGILIGIAAAQPSARVFEIRRYTTHPGRLDALNARFRDHTVRLFRKHGIESIGYWTPQDAPLAGTTLIYVLAHRSREAAKQNWESFRKDADWIAARTASESAGPIVARVESVFVDATEYSPLR